MNIVRKPVAFNLDDPDQKELYDHAMKRTNFSAYIKRLIQRDMEGGTSHYGQPVTVSQEFDASEFI
ncbi:hypothetical protein UM396_14385 [Geobacillus subterraneus]|uniref:hypothetical protein n=1 Tax=Geobacillus subterraneus TaxID=129338 RepID=UPI002AC8A7F0|nr:hypothetical protein [Geobacillus subterraneus]WPZ17769.1 hypothetical protein UM396_14385 [Geobacillus subterraneus]